MSGTVRLLRADWEALVRAYPGVDRDELAASMVARGREIVSRAWRGVQLPSPDERSRNELARRAASVGFLRFTLVAQRRRFAEAERLEQETYERHLQLDTDVVPPLKLEAKRLRAELRSVEAEAERLGVVLDEAEPAIDWEHTILVDGYESPKYESNEQRRRTAVEFFRRVGGE